MKDVTFRRARPDEASLLTEIALRGKQHWGYPSQWIAWWRPDLVVTPHYLSREWVEVAELDGVVIGFAGLSTGDDGRFLEHLWLRPECIGRGYGRALFEAAVRLAREEGQSELLINADPNAEAFYLRMGAARIGQEIYELPDRVRREVPLLRYIIQ